MGYVAVTGGTKAIRNADRFSVFLRLRGESKPLEILQIMEQMRYLVDRVMGEGGLYAPYHAALALKQSEGDPLEASFYLRAYRSTLPRRPDSRDIDTENILIMRRISSAFKNIPGGQILGPANDYRQRLLDFSLESADESTRQEIRKEFLINDKEIPLNNDLFKKVTTILREEGLVRNDETDSAFTDITRDPLAPPFNRSTRLQSMARGETGGLLAMAYSSMRGYGSIHPTIAELRVGYVDVKISHPYKPDQQITVGRIMITEAEIISKFDDDNPEQKPQFGLGYGCCFGWNENKAISMAVLDRTTKHKIDGAPATDEEFVIMHTDGIESSGFCSHFKLPHYITFQADLDRIRASGKKSNEIKTSEAVK